MPLEHSREVQVTFSASIPVHGGPKTRALLKCVHQSRCILFNCRSLFPSNLTFITHSIYGAGPCTLPALVPLCSTALSKHIKWHSPTATGVRNPPMLAPVFHSPQNVPRSLLANQRVRMDAEAGAPRPCVGVMKHVHVCKQRISKCTTSLTCKSILMDGRNHVPLVRQCGQ